MKLYSRSTDLDETELGEISALGIPDAYMWDSPYIHEYPCSEEEKVSESVKLVESKPRARFQVRGVGIGGKERRRLTWMSRWRGGLEWTEEGSYSRKERVERMADSDLKRISIRMVLCHGSPAGHGVFEVNLGTFKARMAQMDGDSKNLSFVYSAHFV
jgi:hypothetical protein